jgi:hypothetical protein
MVSDRGLTCVWRITDFPQKSAIRHTGLHHRHERLAAWLVTFDLRGSDRCTVVGAFLLNECDDQVRLALASILDRSGFVRSQ